MLEDVLLTLKANMLWNATQAKAMKEQKTSHFKRDGVQGKVCVRFFAGRGFLAFTFDCS